MKYELNHLMAGTAIEMNINIEISEKSPKWPRENGLRQRSTDAHGRNTDLNEWGIPSTCSGSLTTHWLGLLPESIIRADLRKSVADSGAATRLYEFSEQ